MSPRAEAASSPRDRAVLWLVSGGRSGRLDPGLEWREVDETCRSLGLGPWLVHALPAADPGAAIPAAFRASCQTQAQVNTVLQALRQAELRRIHDAMTAAGAPFVLLKGIALALFVYDTPVQRRMSDIDIWVRGGDLPRAAAALQSAGFRPLPRNPSGWLAASGKVQVELHDRIRHELADEAAARPAEERMWAGIVTRRWSERDWLVLHPTDFLHHVARHLSLQHGFVAQLAHLVDVDVLARRFPAEIDYARLLSPQAIGASEARALRLVLTITKRLLGTPVPDDVVPLPASPTEPEMLALTLLLHSRRTPLVTRSNAVLASRSGADALARMRALIGGVFEKPPQHQVPERASFVDRLLDRVRHHRRQYSLKDLRLTELRTTRETLMARERLLELLDAD